MKMLSDLKNDERFFRKVWFVIQSRIHCSMTNIFAPKAEFQSRSLIDKIEISLKELGRKLERITLHKCQVAARERTKIKMGKI